MANKQANERQISANMHHVVSYFFVQYMFTLVTNVRNPTEGSLSNREHVSYVIKVRWDGFQQSLTVGL